MHSRRTRLRLVFGGVLAAVVLLLTGIWLGGHPSDLPPFLRGSPFQERRAQLATQQALNILIRRYYRPLNRSSLVDQGLGGMVAGLEDPYSHYIDPSTYAADEAETHTTGIGISTMPEPDGLLVVDVVEGSPAAHAGLMRADLITEIGSTPLAGREGEFSLNLIRGPAGTPVTLTYVRDGKKHVVSVVRAKIVVPAASSRMLTYRDKRIGYLRLREFSEGSGEELRAEARRLLDAHAQALVFDLRRNGGGLISEAITVASTFMTHGRILSAVERDRPRRVYDAQGNAIAPRIPMVVLVDHGTASSAEIVTAALQDHGRAQVVGARTYGKNVFQQTQRLVNGGALEITIGEWFTPDGRNLGRHGTGHETGITPNVYALDNPRTPADEALAVAERTVAAEVR